MEALDRLVETLSDGYWHKVNKLRAKVDLTEKKLEKALEFLKTYGFIHLSKGGAKLTNEMLMFQHDIRDLENQKNPSHKHKYV